MSNQMPDQLQHHLMQANLYGLLAKRYEYVDPAKHMHFYQKYFEQVQQVEAIYMGMHGNNMGSHHMNASMRNHLNTWS